MVALWVVFCIPLDPSHQEVEAALDLGTVLKAVNIQGIDVLAVCQTRVGSNAHCEDTNREVVTAQKAKVYFRLGGHWITAHDFK